MNNDYTIDVLRLLEELKETAERPKQLLGLTIGYDKNELAIQIDKVRASLPRDLKEAANIARECERIVNQAHDDANTRIEQSQREAERRIQDAQAQAERILQQAQLKQDQLLADSEILKLAKAQAEEVRNAAERDARAMRQGADRYAADVLGRLDAGLGKLMSSVQKVKSEMEPHAQPAVEHKASAKPDRDRVKVM